MMNIRVVAYGIARDIVGGNQVEVSLDEGQTVADTVTQLKARFPSFDKLSSVSLAVNESYVANDYVLSEGDEVVIIPPVSGG